MSKTQELKDLISQLSVKLLDITDPDEHKLESAKLHQAFEDLRSERVAREENIHTVIASINKNNFTLAELLGYTKLPLHKNFSKEENTVAAPSAGEGERKSMEHPYKSKKTGETAIWLRTIPQFLIDEGCLTDYKEGKAIDEWLVDFGDARKNEVKKIRFLLLLEKHMNQEPNKIQLGSITWEKFTKTRDAKAKPSAPSATPAATTTPKGTAKATSKKTNKP